uniref:Cystatin domain-containing protein n=1 Tax=Brassica campestris TaxID=3711 RepID=M4CF01_BRACM
MYVPWDPKCVILQALTLLGSLNRGITDPWDPKCVRAYSMYVPGKEPEGTKRMLEKIRGKRDIRIHYHTQVEECRIINDQIVKSQGFDVDFSKLRYLFDFQPAFLDEVYPLGKPDTGRVCFGRLSAEAIEIYNKKRGDDLSLGTNFEFVEVEKANIYSNSGEVYFITFVAKDPLDKKTKVFQAKVIHVFCREIVLSFCRLKPNQPVLFIVLVVVVMKKHNCVFNLCTLAVTCDDEESIAKKAPISRLKIKPGCINSNLKGDGLGLGDKQAAQPKSKEQRSSEATYENRAEGDEYKQRMMSELANRFFALASFDLS